MMHASSMPFHRLTALLCFGMVIAALLPAVAAYCETQCGGVEIPYPFGVDEPGSGCARPGFELSCNDTGNGVHKPFFAGNNELLSISLHEGQVRTRMTIASYCYNTTSHSMDDGSEWYWYLDLTETPYRFSDTGNMFTVIGARTLAYVGVPDDVGNITTGCVATCRQSDLASLTDGTCSGIGCCQTAIPKGLQYLQVSFEGRFNTTGNDNMSRCSYAALMEASNFTFSTSYLMNSSAFNDTYGGGAPVVLDWAVGNEACEAARKKPKSYACVSSNSECFNSPNGPGYICNCSKGFQGNPYLQDPDGCKDIDECKYPKEYPCYGICENKPGRFDCFCPSGARGNASIGPCEKVRTQLAIGIAIGAISGGFGILLFSFSVIILLRRRKRYAQEQARRKYFRQNHGLLLEQLISCDQNANDKTKIFSLEELEKATNDFDATRILGRGGHGMVYKGILSNQHVVAIKKSKVIEDGEINQFINEVAILSQINHRNIVKLFGCCLETEVPLLVYDFIPNGSLFQNLYDESNNGFSLSWDDCMRIAIETAGALHYLHSAASISVFHRDVKSSNILLDANYTAKVSDFGASRLVPIDQTHVVTNVQGTFGYLDPEYYHTGQLNEKSDVYSFGVVLLELLLRKQPIFTTESGSKQNLSNYFIWETKRRPVSEIVCAQVLEEATEEEIKSVASLAEMCLRLRGEERPTMKQVEMALQSLRMKRLNTHDLSLEENEEMQPLISARAKANCHSWAIDSGDKTNLTYQQSQNCGSLEKEYMSSLGLPR